MSEYDTKPMLEAVLKNLESLRDEMRSGFTALRSEIQQQFWNQGRRLDLIEKKFDHVQHRILNSEAEIELIKEEQGRLKNA